MLETADDPVAAYVGDRRFRLVIGGETCDATGGATYDTYDPSTGKVLTQAPLAAREDVERAIAAAKAAYPAWSAMGVRGRRDAFERLAAVVQQHAEELAALDAIDGGNPIEAMRFDLTLSVWNIRDWPGLALALTSDVIPEASPGRNLHYTLYEPYGVVARIVPFNHPAMFAITRVLPALIAGNAVVLKPGEQTPLSALRFGELAADVLPPGVLNVVTGGVETGDALVTSRDVKRIAFTGSTRTALAIQRRVAEFGIKHLSLELGGKNAMVVCPDADVEAVVRGAIDGMNMTVCQGQSCGSNSRVFVHRKLYDDYLSLLREQLNAIRVGPAYEPESEMGPVVSDVQRDRILGYIESAKRDGARLVAGGGPPEGTNGGYFVAPTAFADVEMQMTIAREEIFGPVISVLPWDDYETMIAEANDVEYGLTASVWTHDLDLAHRTVQRLDAGYVWINDSAKHYWGTPFGGTKNSGLGREESVEELVSYYELKAVHTILGGADAALARLGG
jgi:acyl-CoA reductase-like NAD-dependent aldehyde dehydrogenase